MIEDFEFVKEYDDLKVGDTVREPYTRYVRNIIKEATNHLGETIYFLEDIAGYFVKEELELIKEKESGQMTERFRRLQSEHQDGKHRSPDKITT